MSEPVKSIVPIEPGILLVRGHRVILSPDLAAMYGVEPRALVQAVKRNKDRFPPDFMFQLTVREWDNLRSQSVISSGQHGGRRHAPYAFTEQGVAMLSSVLRSKRAVAVNIEIMRAFVRLRRLLAENADLSHRLDELERKYDGQFAMVFDAIRQLMAEPEEDANRPRIGYQTEMQGEMTHEQYERAIHRIMRQRGVNRIVAAHMLTAHAGGDVKLLDHRGNPVPRPTASFAEEQK